MGGAPDLDQLLDLGLEAQLGLLAMDFVKAKAMLILLNLQGHHSHHVGV